MRAAALALLLVLAAAPSAAQLASPGRLTRAHAALEGMRSCTRCHELRQQGISAAKCLECHAPLQARIRAQRGYHGRLEDTACARCHQEHIGVDADIVRFDTTAFRHDRTGWVLRGAHTEVGCRECHRSGNVAAADVKAYAPTPQFLSTTWLGAATTCAGCHRASSPHEPSITRRPCEDCHQEQGWTSLRDFDHARTAYPLTGAHREVACAACHGTGKALKLVSLPHARCGDCHRDPHAGRFGAACAECHETAGWGRVPASRVAGRFDHARTAFPLRGAHARAACAACHDRAARRPGIRLTFAASARGATFPAPVVRSCGSCHVDFHAGQLRSDAAACDRCHTEASWLPVRFDVARHQRETRFPLVGAHLAVPCGQCHARAAPGQPPRLRWSDTDCRACHLARDPHRGMFPGRPCGECHTGGEFRGATFDHAGVRAGSCASCHIAEDPHGDQFGDRTCDACHETGRFAIPAFDHARTRFPLDGAHARAPCASCHRKDERGVVRYRPLDTRCASCHGGRS